MATLIQYGSPEYVEQWEGFGRCTVPDGERGDWAVQSMRVTAEDVLINNLRAAISGQAYLVAHPGTYRRLVHKRRGVIMSNVHMEVRTNAHAHSVARGNVLVAGLGLGMMLEGLLAKPEVTSIVVVELSPDVIALVGPHFARHGDRVCIVQGDIHDYCPGNAGLHFDFAWIDIWDDICPDNMKEMATLYHRLAPHCDAMEFWTLRELIAHADEAEDA